MSQETTVDEGQVTNGETTSYDTTKAQQIQILNAECRWQGVTTSSGSTDSETKTNTASDTTQTQTNNKTAEDSFDAQRLGQDPSVQTVTYPSPPSGTMFDGHTLVWDITVDNAADQDLTADLNYAKVEGGSIGETVTVIDQFGYQTLYDKSVSPTSTAENNYVSEGRTLEVLSVAEDGFYDSDLVANASAQTHYIEEVLVGSASTPLPSPSSGYAFQEHTVEITVENTTSTDKDISVPYQTPWTSGDISINLNAGGVYTVTETSNTNYAGDTVSADGEIGEGIKITVTAQTDATKDTTTTEQTENPSVGGDVSASYSGTLSDGEWSPWQSLSGLTANQSNTFSHSISGSGSAEFRFRYTWEYIVADAVYPIEYHVNGTTYESAVIDPTADNADITTIRVVVNGVEYALDGVAPTASDALPIIFQTPLDGEVALRDRSNG